MPFVKPEDALLLLKLTPGEKVADFGGGSGSHALALANAVGQAGKVFVIDVQNELLEKLGREARESGAENVSVIWGDLERPLGSKLPDASVEAVLISNTLFQTDARYQVALEAKRILKVGGRVAVVEWRGSFSGLGPQEASVIAPVELKAMFEQAGFKLAREQELGDYHHGYLFTKD